VSDPRDVEAHMEPAPPPQEADADAATSPASGVPASDAGSPDGPASVAALTPLGAESLAAPAAAVLSDPGDVSLLALIDRLSNLLDRTDLTELEVQAGSTALVLRKPEAVAPPPAAAAAAASLNVPAGPGSETAATNGVGPLEGPPTRPSVKAPLTGIWYSSPAPGSAPYVSAGGEVNTGQVIGLIEAMKLFNEIKSDLAGRVTRVYAEEGKLVKAKQPLIEVEPL
jgi:acetyl-CoA carboxylase biotin carboxyl carrier protein